METNDRPAEDPALLDRLYQIREHLQHGTQHLNDGNGAYTLTDMLKMVNKVLAGRNAGPVTDVITWRKKGEGRTCNIRWHRFGVSPGPLYAVPPKLTSDNL